MNRLLGFLLLLFSGLVYAQPAPFQVLLEPQNIEGIGGLQSFAHAEHKGKWLIIGGRLDGLHRRQPFAAFDLAGHNNQIIVIDPEKGQHWSAPLSSLPQGLQEQLSATNMQFYKENKYLYIVGGYGFSATANDHKTYPNLTAIEVPAVIEAVIKGKDFSAYFQQITDPLFAVCGGHLKKIYDTYYLVGGHLFDGRYNPLSADHGSGFVQIYTNAIRKFSIENKGKKLQVQHLSQTIDSQYLHRRDYNLVPQILPNGQEGLTAFSGVFQQHINLPFLHSVNIDSQSYALNAGFSQYYNHYHCATMPLYSEKAGEMHSLFFGGIAEYYDSLGVLVQDNNVPFVRSIARVTRNREGEMSEYKLPIEMPALLGTGAEFILLPSVPHYHNKVIKLDELRKDTTLVGYIYGGIQSTAPNIFWINDAAESTASSGIFKVFIIKNADLPAHQLNEQSRRMDQLQVYTNLEGGHFTLQFRLQQAQEVQLSIADTNGKILLQSPLSDAVAGENIYVIEHIGNFGAYYITLEIAGEKINQKINITPQQ